MVLWDLISLKGQHELSLYLMCLIHFALRVDSDHVTIDGGHDHIHDGVANLPAHLVHLVHETRVHTAAHLNNVEGVVVQAEALERRVDVRLQTTAVQVRTVRGPVARRRRRGEGIPELVKKFKINLARRFPAKQQAAILAVCENQKTLETTPVHEFVNLFEI